VADAKPGDELSAEAIKALYQGRSEFLVVDKCAHPSPAGRWVCIDCGEVMLNNMMAGCHEKDNKNHRIAWKCAECGRYESAPAAETTKADREGSR
jgi:hypothetical protein